MNLPGHLGGDGELGGRNEPTSMIFQEWHPGENGPRNLGQKTINYDRYDSVGIINEGTVTLWRSGSDQDH